VTDDAERGPASAPSPRYFATASRGTEEVLAAELVRLGVRSVDAGRGGVAFGEALEDAYRACLWSRIASRVLVPLARFDAADADGFYDGVHAIPWHDHLDPSRTLAVAVAGSEHPAGPPHFLALKAKDAIVDRIRAARGTRPDVDPKRPDLRVHVHVRGSGVSLSVDLAGRGLHRRGRGRIGTEAPLRETLAAAMLGLAGWPGGDPTTPLLDPMCGSGTLLLEAAGIALDLAPGLTRGAFGARGWLGHDTAAWGRLRAEAEDRRRAGSGRRLLIAGCDAAPSAIEAARANLRRAGLGDRVRLRVLPLADLTPHTERPGVIVTNPPYGERLGEAGELGPLYETLGDVTRRRFPGWRLHVLTGNRALAKCIGLRPEARHPLWNGPIECRLLSYGIAADAPRGAGGPGWRRPDDSVAPFVKVLCRNARERDRWAEREGIEAYRLYDSDVPEWNVAIDRYGDAVRVEEYARPTKVDPAVAERRLRDVMRSIPEALGVDPRAVVLRVRRRLGRDEQPGRRAETEQYLEVREGDLVFRVNLHDRLDTGLYLDDREVRRYLREHAADRDVLNLFAYTCTASVAAAAGGARSTTSVDLSRRYLDWGESNLRRNGFGGREHARVRADALRFLESGRTRRTWDLILVAPPSRSRSKGMEGTFDVQRDHGRLLSRAAARLSPGGRIVFTTHLRRFAPDITPPRGIRVTERTVELTPPDFRARPRLRAWILEHRPDEDGTD
jgi:23S rRNA (guanine2445-N2)-methyltransferase / 23S rRNA (guanine2069-N7)-methyltransferase